MADYDHIKTTAYVLKRGGMVELVTESKSARNTYEGGKTAYELSPVQAVALGHDLIAAGEAGLAKVSK